MLCLERKVLLFVSHAPDTDAEKSALQNPKPESAPFRLPRAEQMQKSWRASVFLFFFSALVYFFHLCNVVVIVGFFIIKKSLLVTVDSWH
jgi:hypothetical protein